MTNINNVVNILRSLYSSDIFLYVHVQRSRKKSLCEERFLYIIEIKDPAENIPSKRFDDDIGGEDSDKTSKISLRSDSMDNASDDTVLFLSVAENRRFLIVDGVEDAIFIGTKSFVTVYGRRSSIDSYDCRCQYFIFIILAVETTPRGVTRRRRSRLLSVTFYR
uniref:Uncharacterized protein n=1 Tax=Romanomermis culicivorax TaxID=13658 RepID=A0A915IJZ1_ROMCU